MPKNELTHISAKKAAALLANDPTALFIDVRSDMEYLFIGHPKGSVNIPWIEAPDWEVNPNFERDVRKLILGGVIQSDEHNSSPILLLCRSGKRSEEAGNLLIKKGFKQVYNIELGFEGDLDENHQRNSTGGWRYDGLPWEQS